MKSPPMTTSSGSLTYSKQVILHPTESGVKKTFSGRNKPSKAVKLRDLGSQEEQKWQAFFASAQDVSTDNDTVREKLLDAVGDDRAKKEAEISSHSDIGEESQYDVKGLMAQIYQDLHNVATAQAFRSAPEGVCAERDFIGEVDDIDGLLLEVSIGVSKVIKSAFAHLQVPLRPHSSEVSDNHEKTSSSFSSEDPSRERYSKLAADHGGKFLGKLAHSAAFREAACNVDTSQWQKVSTTIEENVVSLTVFVENCNLDWWTELMPLNSLFSPPLDFTKYQPSKKPKKYNPHKWIVTDKLEDIRRPTFEGKRQINIRKNIYNASAFQHSPRPAHWPADRSYPDDPTIARGSPTLKPCLSCHSHQVPCFCAYTTSTSSSPSLITNPLLELHSYGAPKGIGIRSLTRIPPHTILGEYLGEIHPRTYAQDPIYGFDFSIPGQRSHEVIAMISAKRYGNWTRFMNHSCDASTRFDIFRIGGRNRVVVKSLRSIEVFEEVTVHYGDYYWCGKRCLCGVEGCVGGRVDREGEEAVVEGEEVVIEGEERVAEGEEVVVGKEQQGEGE